MRVLVLSSHGVQFDLSHCVRSGQDSPMRVLFCPLMVSTPTFRRVCDLDRALSAVCFGFVISICMHLICVCSYYVHIHTHASAQLGIALLPDRSYSSSQIA